MKPRDITPKKTYCVHSVVYSSRIGVFVCADCSQSFSRIPMVCGYPPLIVTPAVGKRLPAMPVNTIIRYNNPVSHMTVFFRKGSLCSRWRSKFWMN